MRTSWPVACAAVLILGLFSTGCGKTSASASTEDKAAGTPDGIHEYRAVCTTKDRHAGLEIVLSAWLDTKKAAAEYADYHTDHKFLGHVARIDERIKPKKAEPAK